MGVYAPTSEAGAGARRTLRQQLTVMQGMAPATSLQIIAGDFNAEFGNNADHTIPGYEATPPDIAQMRGPTPDAERKRQLWISKVEERLRVLQPVTPQSDLTEAWSQLCQICREVAVEVCGVLNLVKGAPWLASRGPEVAALDQAIHQAKQGDNQARRQGDPHQKDHARRLLQRARKHKAETLRKWESDWLSARADAANQAMSTPHTADIFRIVKQLCQTVAGQRPDSGSRQARNSDEVEAWKEHFEAIQAGSGTINPSVWQDISTQVEDSTLGLPPTWEEYQRVVRDMRLGKAGGSDSMTAEYIKFAGPSMERMVFDIVLSCWNQASAADDPSQAAHWPQAWKTGRNLKRTRFGDMAYADDTAIMGREPEVLQAEPILITTIQDFGGKVNAAKTEGLRADQHSHFALFPVRFDAVFSSTPLAVGDFSSPEASCESRLALLHCMANVAERKRKLEDLEKKVDDQAALLDKTVGRVDRLEERCELAEAYRFLRVEHSSSLTELWAGQESGAIPRHELRSRVATGLVNEIRQVFAHEVDETTAKQKSDTLSNNKRTWPARTVRDETAQGFKLDGLVEWVSKVEHICLRGSSK
ncbi:unnamed protein product, partial [Durusdinium trenchii]